MRRNSFKLKVLIIASIICMITSNITYRKVEAKIRDNLPVSYIDKNFPASYRPYLEALQKKHPKWVFNAVHTGLDWNTVLSHESYEVNLGISLVEQGYGDEWKRTNGDVVWDETYVTASKEGVAYVLDPRNFLCEEGIFQFETLRFVGDTQTVESVQTVLAPTPMGSTYKNKYKYMGEWRDLGTTYAELIYSLSKAKGINPVHIASRIRQENSGDIINNRLINGDYGVYNFFNIGAYQTETQGALANGVKRAQEKGWTNVRAGIQGGIDYIYDNYVQWGQNTIYFERFDVNNTGSAQWLLGTGYMTNIFGAKNEAKITYNAYADAGLLDYAFQFDIPVYENMPEDIVEMPVPDGVAFTKDNTKVYLDDPSDSGATDEFWIRSGPDSSISTIIDKIYETKDGQENRTVFTRIGKGNSETLYDKIQYSDGRVGYILKKWVYEYKYTKVKNVTLDTTYTDLSVGDTLKLNATVSPNNAYDKSVKWTTSNKELATVDVTGKVTALKEGVVTITATTIDQNKQATCTINITSSKHVTSISLGSNEYSMYVGSAMTLKPTILPSTATNKNYRIEIADSSVARVDGLKIIGVAPGNTTAKFITEDGGHEATTTIVVKAIEEQGNIVLKGNLNYENNVITGIDLNNNKVSDIKKNIDTKYTMKFIGINGNELNDTDRVGTSTKVQFLDGGKRVEEYSIVIYGDVDGSGTISARDLLVLQRYIIGTVDINSMQVKASIIDKVSSYPRAIDLLKIQRHIIGKYVIEQ